MALQTNLNMKSKEQGLTIGELTIAISALIITGLIWTTISNKIFYKYGSVKEARSNKRNAE